ncbi:MAG: hypothetical protein JWM53_502, partial [bacterium]|nr:hypothetical protein [bacterium]
MNGDGQNPFEVLAGISWGDVGDAGKVALPYVHTAGKGLAGAFGAGAAAQAVEDVEVSRGWLPPQKPSVPSLKQRLDAIKQATVP